MAKVDMNKKEIKMDEGEFKEEHKRLLNVLDSKSHKDDKEEAKKQRKEVKRELDKADKLRIDKEADGKQEIDYGKEELDKDDSHAGVAANQDAQQDYEHSLKRKWKKLKKALANEAFMSIVKPEEAEEQEAPQEEQPEMGDDEMHDILSQLDDPESSDGSDESGSEDTDMGGEETQEDFKENELPEQEESEGEEGAEDLEEMMSKLGYSETEIAHVIHGHHFPDVDELKSAKADTERAKKEGELSLQELEMQIKQGEHQLKSGGAEKLNSLDLDHKSQMNAIEVEHAKKMKQLEYMKAQREAEASDEVEHKRKLREIEQKKHEKDIPGDRFDDTHHQKRMMDLEYEKAKREMELDLQIKKQQSELKMKQMIIDAEVRKKEKDMMAKESAQVKKDESVKKKSKLSKSLTDLDVLCKADGIPGVKLANEVGKTHTVEVHPDMDMYYRAKGLIKENNKPHMQVGDFKRHGFPEDIVKKLPRDAKGKVTPEMIDDHISNLPKQKVNVQVGNYTWGAQKHRDNPQHTLSVQYHPDTLKNMPKDIKNHWDVIKDNQHNATDQKGEHQIGWSRVDSHKNENGTATPHNHWHVDEIQSDFQNEDKINNKSLIHEEATMDRHVDDVKEDIENDPDHEFHEIHNKREQQRMGSGDEMSEDEEKKNKEYEKYVNDEANKRTDNDITEMKNSLKGSTAKGIHEHLSHGHRDPQHLVHSATNALARKLGVDSMSMDTSEDQARQSGLRSVGMDHHNNVRENAMFELMERFHPDAWKKQEALLSSGEHPSFNNPNFKSAYEKIGLDDIAKLSNISTGTGSSVDAHGNAEGVDSNEGHDYHKGDGRLTKIIKNLSDPEVHALNEMLYGHHKAVEDEAEEEYIYRQGEYHQDEHTEDKFDMSKLPVHQQDTYHKRPKRLGMKEVPKSTVLGEHETDKANKIQYMNLHKRLQELKELLSKGIDNG